MEPRPPVDRFTFVKTMKVDDHKSVLEIVCGTRNEFVAIPYQCSFHEVAERLRWLATKLDDCAKNAKEI